MKLTIPLGKKRELRIGISVVKKERSVMYKVEDVVNYYLSKESMTPKKLQKILYYAYSWFLTLENESPDELINKLFEENFEAWIHGPVIPKVYANYKGYGYNEIAKYEDAVYEFDQNTLAILEDVWGVYGEYDGNELESISHQESPWINARGECSVLERCRNPIKDEDIFNCYASRLV